MSLLVLDADSNQASLVSQELADLGFTCRSVASSSDAVSLCMQGNVRVVVCCDTTLLEQLEDLPAGVGLVMTSSDEISSDLILQCMRRGVQDYWPRPFQQNLVQASVERICARYQQLLGHASEELQAMRLELEQDQRAGQHVQLRMLPPNPLQIGAFTLSHRVEPSLLLSGDFVDYFQITDRHFACYVADVAGHGASSAFVTVLLKNFSRRFRRDYQPSMLANPGEALAWLNTELIDEQLGKHVAMFLAVIDTQDNCLHYANAAHFPPALLVEQLNGREVMSLEQKGKPLGLFPEITFETVRIEFPRGASLVVFSDGVLDLISGSTLEYKEQNLIRAVQTHTDMQSIWAQLDVTQLGKDDVSCLVVRHHEGDLASSIENVAS